MNNMRIADALDQIADILEFQGANSFRVRAYRNGSRIVRSYSQPLEAIVNDPERKLTDIAGIGKDLADKISTLVTTGKLPWLEQLQTEVPPSVMTLLRIPGLGPKKAAVLVRELGVSSLDELRDACQAQRVRGLKGFAAKTEETILAGIDQTATAIDRIYWATADEFAQAISAHLAQCPSVEKIEMAGSYRRGRDTIGDLDVLVVSSNPAEVMDRFASFVEAAGVLGRGDTKMTIRLLGGLQVDLRVVPAESFGAALQYFTGSKDHNVVLRGIAKNRGLKVNEYGVFRLEDSREIYVAGRTEEEVYGALGLPCFPPELREARREFEWVAAGALPKLIELGDLRGDLHMHTTATDGKNTLEEMAAAAQARGLEYIAITDHSQRVSMAGGLDATRLRQQWREIDRLNAEIEGIVLLKGIEVDILERGGLDLPDDVLSEADWVVASLHYGQKQPRDQITRRMLGAVENRYVSAIGHPTGRLINRRRAYDVDLDAVLRAARDHGKMMELNSNPARLDLDDVACAAARDYGVPIVISSDAHSIGGLEVLRYGILQARRAGLTKHDVANTRSLAELRKLIAKSSGG